MLKLVLVILVFVSCSNSSMNDQGETCDTTQAYSCPVGDYVQFNYCIDLSILDQDDRLQEIEQIELWVETPPWRDGRQYAIHEKVDGNLYQGTFCVPINPEADSLIFSYFLGSNRTTNNQLGFVPDFAAFDKLEVKQEPPYVLIKEVIASDVFGRGACPLPITYNIVPSSVGLATGTACLIGSYSDCFGCSINYNPLTFDSLLIESVSHVQEWYDGAKKSTPCSGIHIVFD